MNLHKVDLKGLQIPNNVFLAPLAGYTNAVFRAMCAELGAGLTCTEMVSAKGLCYGNEKTRGLLKVINTRDVTACQLFGGEADYMRAACESEYLAPFKIIDINMGCPVPKIYKNGEGSALMGDLPRAEKIISECKKSGKIISVKFRTGLSEKNKIAREFALMCEGAGADMVCVHGRTRDKMYSGDVDTAQIAAVKNAVKIPVVANGGVFTPGDAERLLQKTGADGVAIARGAMYSPWIFSEIAGLPSPDKKSLVLKQLDDTLACYGEKFACVFMRKMVCFYLRGTRSAAANKVRLLSAASCAELRGVVLSLDFC